jgi:hypothetical protein
MANSTHFARVKRAELLSSLGAGVLGAGIALLLPNQLVPYAIPILLLGLISHSVGMFQKHGLEQQGEVVRVWWTEVLYWFCWLGLVALLFFIVFRLF